MTANNAAHWKAPKDTVFVIVDPQKDFCADGALAVPDGEAIIPLVNALKRHFDQTYLTQDWHPAGHHSFASAHPGKAQFELITAPYGEQRLWPDHCVQGTEGAAFHDDLEIHPQDLILRKGADKQIDSYSAFYENDRKTAPRFDDGQSFAEKLQQANVKRVVFSGLAFDYCVGWNAFDARNEGFDVIVVKDAVRSITPEGEAEMIAKLTAVGVKIVNAQDLPNLLNAKPAPPAPRP